MGVGYTSDPAGPAVAGFCLFDTSIGTCGIAWSADGLTGVQLPEADAGETRRQLAHRFPGLRETSPPPQVQQARDDIVALLRGQPSDLSTIRLDWGQVPAFYRRVYDVTRSIPPGRTASYGEIASALGLPGAARAVGQALGRNPFPLVVPCHRVLAAGGRVGGFSAAGGARTKQAILAIEGAAEAPPTLFDDRPISGS